MRVRRAVAGLATFALAAAPAWAAELPNPVIRNSPGRTPGIHRVATMPGDRAGQPGSLNYGNPFGQFQVKSRISVAGASPNDPRYATPKGMGYDGVGALYIDTNIGGFICSGALLRDGMSVLTAAHCLTDPTPGFKVNYVTPVFFPSGVPGRVILPNTTTFYVHPNYTGEVIDAHDVAVVKLSAPPPSGITAYDIYRGDATGSQFRVVGSGAAGTGSTGLTIGAGFNQGNRRTGLNRYDFSFADSEWGGFWYGYFGSADPNVYLADFDNGTSVNDASCVLAGFFALGGSKFCDTGLGLDEVGVGGGDSGGPQFVAGRIAGVTSFGLTWGTAIGDIDDALNSTFGEFVGFTRVDYNAAWIDAIATPEPISMALLATGLAGIGGASVLRRRRRDPEA